MITGLPTVDAGAQLRDGPRKFVAELRRRHDHLRVVTTLEYLQVGAARQRGFDLNTDFTRVKCLRGDIFNADVFLSMKDCCSHRLVNNSKNPQKTKKKRATVIGAQGAKSRQNSPGQQTRIHSREITEKAGGYSFRLPR